MTKELFTTTEVARKTGATLRQLQWWDEQHVITPQRAAGKIRQYGEEDILRVRLLMALRDQGISLQRARKILRAALTKRQSERVFFATDGRRSYAGTDPAEAFRAVLRMRFSRVAACEIPPLPNIITNNC